MSKIDAYLANNREAFEENLCELLRIPSVSADSQLRSHMGEAAAWVETQFKSMGLATRIVETSGHPMVLAESAAVPGKPTVLVYGHYDVQPPDPLSEWISPPFEPVKRDGNVYARGATDDKGQMLTHLMSAKAWMETEGALPVQVKYLIEGEEEVGSDGGTGAADRGVSFQHAAGRAGGWRGARTRRIGMEIQPKGRLRWRETQWHVERLG